MDKKHTACKAEFSVITNQKILKQALDLIVSRRKILFLDTEFVRVTTYWPRLGLVQIASDCDFFAIDPVGILDLTPLLEVLHDDQILKVFHAGQQDLEIFRTELNCIPKSCFDTQIASQFCGFGESISYGKMVEHYCGVVLDKSSQFTNWLERPLTPQQLEYACNDVKYLSDIYDGVVNDLEKKGYLPWALEEMNSLKQINVDIDQAWRKVKIISQNRKFLAKLQALARVRELIAMEFNKPRRRIMDDRHLIQLAQEKGLTIEKVKTLRGLSNELKASGEIERFVEAFEGVQSLSPEEYPELPKKPSLSDAQKKKVKEIKDLLKVVSTESGITASLIAKSKELETFVRKPHKDFPFKRGWRYEIFGQKAESLYTHST